jgi:capsular polysaccharide export protein
MSDQPLHFLRIPPFPRHRAGALMAAGEGLSFDADALAAELVAQRVGGAFWAPQSDPWTRGLRDDPEAGLVRALRMGGEAARAVVEKLTKGVHPRCPFTGEALDWLEAVRLMGAWRRLIECNRAYTAVFGIAGWKRETLDALLWAGSGPVPYRQCPKAFGCGDGLRSGDLALAWVARAPASLGKALDDVGVKLGEVEDGFIRSAGLGADCVPPLSVLIDPMGSHVDPSRPSLLETVLSTHDFPPELLARAAALRAMLVEHGVGKYGVAKYGVAHSGDPVLPPRSKRRLLVIGQVEDDRAVLLGGAGNTNLSLLQRARAMEPEAELIYKPHPDVEAGHRKGAIPDAQALALADAIERHAPLSRLLGEVDGLHVISSQAGFEALLQGVPVVTHGVPFYAGWGLTQDLAPMPERRGRQLGLDALVAASLILCPRYLDPVTRLPCPVEVLVRRMVEGQADMVTPLVRLRRLQGRVVKLLGLR